ncbi:hypothetical protein H5410_021251 [Solanum commersonii]|uniref:Uncharacterized protein n=1 Tax=Solanum commersonii TaxID=4109 RepID=A0A9J5ZBF9_SOLCO|nr:hypothetical protein H5410_021251 [Solanum commersonii]
MQKVNKKDRDGGKKESCLNSGSIYRGIGAWCNTRISGISAWSHFRSGRSTRGCQRCLHRYIYHVLLSLRKALVRSLIINLKHLLICLSLRLEISYLLVRTSSSVVAGGITDSTGTPGISTIPKIIDLLWTLAGPHLSSAQQQRPLEPSLLWWPFFHSRTPIS